SREGRLDTGITPLAFQGLDECGLFPTDIGARATMYIYFTIKSGTEDILTQPAIVPCFRNSLLQYVRYPGIFAADIDIGALAAQGIGRDDQPFDKQVREEFHQVPVLERTRLGFIRIAYQVSGHTLRLGQKAPLHTRRETCATATA